MLPFPMLAALIAALVVTAGLTSAVIYLATKLSQAHQAERVAVAREASVQTALHVSQAHVAVLDQNAKDFHATNELLAKEYDLQAKVLADERARALRAERQRDALLRTLAEHQDPAALVASINDELARLAQGAVP